MKRVTISVLIMVLLLSVSAFAKTGMNIEKIYFDVRMQEEIGIQDVINGKTDIFFQGVTGPQMQGLKPADLEKLELYSVPSGSLSFNLNNYPGKAPYTYTQNGKTTLNPFAIQEVRFALNFLMNRKYIVDEILGGAGFPMYTITTPGQPGTYKYELNAAKMGFSAEGDEAKALKDIEAAMTAAANLPENKGKMKKDKSGFWTYNGEPISIKFAIRVDDPNVRVKVAEYFSKQIEKSGIKVERLMYDRVKCIEVSYYSNPADMLWHMYTEGWLAGATRRVWDHIVRQFYAPWGNYMPGGNNPAFWNHKNDKLDELNVKAYSGNVMTEDEYWDAILEAQTLGLNDALRIFIAIQTDTYLVNKSAFKNRFAYGLGDGLNQWSLITANPTKDTIRVTQFSAKGGLFMSAWNPVGVDGFSDAYSGRIADLLYDPAMFESPVDAYFVPLRTKPVKTETKVHRDAKGDVVGDIAVPATAVKYDAKLNKWVQVGAGEKSMSMVESQFVWSNMHQGIPMSMEDYMFAESFLEEWRVEDTPGDPYYEAEIDADLTPTHDNNKGTIYDVKNNKVISYFQFNSPEKNRVEGRGAAGWTTTLSGQSVGVSWEIVEALGRMVAKGSTSGTVWSFSASKEGATEVDVLNEKCVADIKAELKKMAAEKHIPDGLKGYTTTDKVVKRYEAAIKFIDNYGHAYISNGPFFLAKYDTKASYAEVRAFRDATYPYNSQYWVEQFKKTVLSIDTVEMGMLNVRGKDILVRARVSQAIYPEVNGKPATTGKVTVTFIADKEYKFEATRTAAGVFDGKISGEITKSLKPGTYTVLIEVGGDGLVGEALTKTVVVR